MLMISSPAVNGIFCAVPIGMIPFRSSFIDFFRFEGEPTVVLVFI